MTHNKTERPDYRHLIDTDTWNFINTTSAQFPDNAIELSIKEQRAYYNSMCQYFNDPDSHLVKKKDYALGDRQVGVREYTSNNSGLLKTIILYLHGGGFVFGGLESHDSVCAALCEQTQLTVVACDYALAPEYHYPDALLDVTSVYKALADQRTERIILVGDSAGATLAASLAARCRAQIIQPITQVLIYPYLGTPLDEGSAVVHANAPLLATEDIFYYEKMRLSEHHQSQNDGQTSPLNDKDFSNLPTTIVFCAECDPLCDDGPRYCSAIRESGGSATCIVEKGLVHGYLRARRHSSKARASFTRICNTIIACSNETLMF